MNKRMYLSGITAMVFLLISGLFCAACNQVVTEKPESITDNPDFIIFDADGLQDGYTPATYSESPSDNVGILVAGGAGRDSGKALQIKITSVTNWFELKIIAKNPVDLAEFDALTFTIKSDENMKFQMAGFGSATGSIRKITYTGEFDDGIPVTTNWQQVIVPTPIRLTESADMVFYLGGTPDQLNGRTIWIDSISFIDDPHKKLIGLMLPYDGGLITHKSPYTYPANSFLFGLRATYSVLGTQASLYGENNNFNDFYPDIQYVISGDGANMDADGITVKTINQGTRTFGVKVGLTGINSNLMTMKLLVQQAGSGTELVIDDFEYVENWHRYDLMRGGPIMAPYWYGGDGDAQYYDGFGHLAHLLDKDGEGTVIAGQMGILGSQGIAMFFGNIAANGWVGWGKNDISFNLGNYASISFHAKDRGTNPDNVYTFTLTSGDTRFGNKVEATVQFEVTGTWEEKVFPLSDFTAKGLDKSNITAYSFSVITPCTGNDGGGLQISLIQAVN